MVVGQTLSHYKILDKLGVGGMGEVYLAEDATLKRQVALKVLPPDLAASRERLDRFQREAETLAALDHPNIVTIYSVEEAEGVRFITMQLVEGRRLSDLISKSGLSLERIFEIAIPLADALAAAHGKGVIHRDLKPGNIMVTDDGRMKVMDFGLAKLRPELDAGEATELPTEPLTEEGRILGTVPYMSPEQLEGKEVDARTDIFSLGVLLYEMATGERPFRGDSSISIITSIIRDTPREVDTLRTNLPHHLGRVIRHCMEKDPERRYQAAKDVRNELEDLRREETSHETVATPPAAWLKGRAKRRWWLAAPVVLVLLGVTLGYLLLRTETRQDAVMVPGAQLPMIVVLPFENLGSPDDEYFVDGMTEEITSRLAVISGLRVISRTSAMQYKKERPPLKQIGSELGVDYVLEGSVRWARSDVGSRVRITPQLIRVTDDSHLWAASYDRVIEDIFSVQSDIAKQVIEQLEVTLLDPEKEALEAQATDNLEAYDAFLLGVHYRYRTEEEEDQQLAVGLLERAVSLDPDFALAYAELAEAHAAFVHFRYDVAPERLTKASRAGEKALELEPNLPEGHRALGAFYYWVHRDYDRAFTELELATSGRPGDSQSWAFMGYVERRRGRLRESITHLEKALALDPRHYSNIWNSAYTYLMVGEYEKAEEYFRRAISIAPDRNEAYYRLANLYQVWDSTPDRARTTLEMMPNQSEPRAILEWLDQENYERRFEEALNRLGSADLDVFKIRTRTAPVSLIECECLFLLSRLQEAGQACERARGFLEQAVREQEEDPRAHSALGVTYALLGHQQEAIHHGKEAVALWPVSKDALDGRFFEANLAKIYSLLGEAELAIEMIERLTAAPWVLSVNTLRQDPTWDPIRDDPSFQALLEKHEEVRN